MVWAEDADCIANALLHAQGCTPWRCGGRGQIVSFPYKGGMGLIRRYLRGGFIRHFLKEGYLFQNRPCKEFKAHLAALECEIPTPPLLGVMWECRGLWVRGAYATQCMKGLTLDVYLESTPPHADTMLQRCGQWIRSMHDANIWHADLQVKNILVTESGPYFLDFDNAHVNRPVSRLQRARNLLRLRRSFEKNTLSPAYFEAVYTGYAYDVIPLWLKWLYTLKGHISNLFLRRKKK